MIGAARLFWASRASWRTSIARSAVALTLATLLASGIGPAILGSFPTVAAQQASCDFRTARFNFIGWKTEFNKCSVSLFNFRPSGVGRDGVSPLTQPRFVTVDEASSWLRENEPVIVVDFAGDARAYPLQIMIWHEIVNDTVGGIPVVVTFSPFASVAAAFERQVPGRTFEFGTTGNLRHSNLVMWDRQTESWWQQISGEAVVGTLTGAQLRPVPASTISWGEFQLSRPLGQVLSRETGQRREYGRNPYVGADDMQAPLHFDSPSNARLRATERIVTMSLGGETAGYPFSGLRDRMVLADTVGGFPVVIFYQSGTLSALDRADMAASRAVGSTGVFAPEANGQPLTFAWDGTAIVDVETGSRWTILGQAISGPLTGAQLLPVVHADSYWAPASVFYPDMRVWTER